MNSTTIRSLGIVTGVLLSAAATATAQHVLLAVDGTTAGDILGRTVDLVGDMNGDGVGDLIAGAPFASPNQPQSGYIVVLDGATGSTIYYVPGAQNGSMLGTSVAAAGDTNLDGFPDFIAGSPLVLPPLPFGPPNPPGQAFVYSGFTGSLLRTFASSQLADGFGRAVDGGSDVNGDGYSDLVVGSDFGNFAQVFSGASGTALHTWSGDTAGDFFGYSVAMLGDTDGDGSGDVAVGARLDDNTGADSGSARVFSGATGGIRFTLNGDSAGDALGYSLAGAGDIDADGKNDIIVGIRNDDDGGTDAGSGRVYSGLNASVLYTIHGEAAGDAAGNTNGVDGAGDVDGDGRADFLIATALNDANGTSSGRVRVFSGVNGSLLGAMNGELPDYLFGVAARGGSDVNGDGLADIVVGAFGDDALFGVNAGHVRVFTISPSAGSANYGAGWPGTNGVPNLIALSPPILGATFGIQIDNSLGASTTGVLLVGLTPNALVTSLGGTLLVAPIAPLTFSLPLLPTGLLLPASLPLDGALRGLSLYLQVLEADAGASKGVSFTPGLRLDLGL